MLTITVGALTKTGLARRADDPIPTLVQRTDLTYTGAFRVPMSAYGFGGGALAYWAAHDTILLSDSSGRIGELSIPTLVNSNTITNLNTASLVQAPTDLTQGHMNEVGGSTNLGVGPGGILVQGNTLIMNVYENYDALQSQARSHFVSGQDFSRLPPVRGPYAVGTAGLPGNPVVPSGGAPGGWVGEYTVAVPPAWQAALGGDALAGGCCLSVISRTSQGPTLSAYRTADLGNVDPVPASVLVGYPQGHETLGSWSGRGTALFTKATQVTGAVWINGTNTILFFGRKGTAGNACYGLPSGDSANSWPFRSVPDGAGGEMCFDSVLAAHGEHAYPYMYFAWAYDANDLAAVKAGTKHAWDVVPYASWDFDLPFEEAVPGGRNIGGAAYDPVTRRLYVAQVNGENIPNVTVLPVIHVFTFAFGSNTGLCR